MIRELLEKRIDSGIIVNMNTLDLIGLGIGLIGFIAMMAAARVVVKSSTTTTTITNQKELIDTLIQGKEEQRELITDLQDKHVESAKAIASMQGQIDVLRTIPLKGISEDLSSIANELKTLSQNQRAIADTLISNGIKISTQ